MNPIIQLLLAIFAEIVDESQEFIINEYYFGRLISSANLPLV